MKGCAPVVTDMGKILTELITFSAFCLICAALLRPRFSRGRSLAVAAGFLLLAALLQVWALRRGGGDVTFALTLLPVTAFRA